MARRAQMTIMRVRRSSRSSPAEEYDDIACASFVAGLPEGVRTWIEAATEATDFQARSKYHLAAGAWLLKQPNMQLLPGRDADAALEMILKQHARTS